MHHDHGQDLAGAMVKNRSIRVPPPSGGLSAFSFLRTKEATTHTFVHVQSLQSQVPFLAASTIKGNEP